MQRPPLSLQRAIRAMRQTAFTVHHHRPISLNRHFLSFRQMTHWATSAPGWNLLHDEVCLRRPTRCCPLVKRSQTASHTLGPKIVLSSYNTTTIPSRSSLSAVAFLSTIDPRFASNPTTCTGSLPRKHRGRCASVSVHNPHSVMRSKTNDTPIVSKISRSCRLCYILEF